MRILLWKEILLLIKKIFTANYFNAPNNIAANATANDNALREKKLAFKNNAPFINCISKLIA